MPPKKKVIVAMSGGVDSSVAAALLQRQGYDCIGVFMRLGGDAGEAADGGVAPAIEPADDPADLIACSPEKATAHLAQIANRKSQIANHKQGCCSAADAADARYVAGLLNIPFYALNFQHDFAGIIDYFVREYNAGRTPNPCVRCNEYLKFGKLARYARAVGADYVATGHYARIRHLPAAADRPAESHLLRARDLSKDQSYVLFGIPPEELPRLLLPLGDLEKSAVRRIAEQLHLPVFDKPDSQEICFVPDNDYAALIRRKSPDSFRDGPITIADGTIVGTHHGHQHYTLGQRKGLRLAFGHPIYITKIDPATNTIVVGEKHELLHRTLLARQINWLVADPATGRPAPPAEPIRCTAKVRYNSPPAPATAMLIGEDRLLVRFDHPVSAITPGQAVVCYEGDRLLGGGWIDEVRQ